jgi:hypothetical protein
MLSPTEFTTLYSVIDNYLASDACKKAFPTNDDSGVNYSKITICVDELICEEYAYPNPHKITDKVNKMNLPADFDKTLIAIKNAKKEVVVAFKYSAVRG